MKKKITDLILDFDGTCTQIPVIWKNFFEDYLAGVNGTLTPAQHISDDLFAKAIAQVKKHSPVAGWRVAITPTAPAAADPYILSGEAVAYLYRTQKSLNTLTPPGTAFGPAYAANPAPWRVETLEVIRKLLARNVAIHFVSNSGKAGITQRFQDLWGGEIFPDTIQVHGGASKFNINEPNWEDLPGWPAQLTQAYSLVPAVQPGTNIGRPLYLRRGNFFSVIAGIFKDQPERLATSLFCGDVWELDLALPAALGAQIHLIERAAPFNTYDYERELTLHGGGKISPDLKGLLDWFK